MRRKTALLALPLAALGVLGVTAAASAGSGAGSSATSMSGAREVGPGDRDGAGAAAVRPGADDVCFRIRYRDIGTPTMAHIHLGPAGVAGDVVVDFTPFIATSAPGVIEGCTAVDPSLASDIQANPSDYYVNVHTAAYPAGAIRGQLRASNG